MRWAIIDDGVDIDMPAIVRNIEIDKFGHVMSRKPTGEMSHATICFRIIEKYAHSLFAVISIKILHAETQRCNKDALIAALCWCKENGIRLIHLSIGTIEPHDFGAIEEVVGQLAVRGVIIVAANSNQGVQTYPAFDNHVIGVECDIVLAGNQFIHTPCALNGTAFRASACHKLTLGDGTMMTPISNSFAAPVITAELLNLVGKDEKFGQDQAMKWLREKMLREDRRPIFAMPHTSNKGVVIVLLGLNSQTVWWLMAELKDHFVREGYSCVLVASTDVGFPDNVSVIPEELAPDHYLCWARLFFASEVVLVGFAGQDMARATGIHADLVVVDDYMKARKGDMPPLCEIIVYTESCGAVRAPQSIYADIIHVLSEEETVI